MNNAELDKLLKSAPAPDRAPEFWEQFPKRITARLHRQLQRDSERQSTPRKPGSFVWAVGAAAACLVLAFVFAIRPNHSGLGETAGQVAQAEKCYREIESLFPNQVQSIVFDETGSRIMLAEKADVPASPPLYLKICWPRGCQEIVTFSGQEIQVAGQIITVLADSRGGIILMGNQFVWSNTERTYAGNHLKIEAINLGAVAM